MKRIAVIVSLFFTACASGQNIHMQDMDLGTLFQADVTTMFEFRERFNRAAEASDSIPSVQRMKGVLSLFNRYADSILNKQDLVLSFAERVLESRQIMAFTDSLWYADAVCDVKYKGANNKIRLLLRTVSDANGICRWTLCGANGLPDAGIIYPSEQGFIEPMDNELNFIDMVSRIRHNYINAFGYRSTDARISQLSILLYLLQEQLLTIEAISRIKYHFLSVPGYVFVVEHSTMPMNSGWLISDIAKITPDEIKMYEKKMFGDL